MAFKWQYRWAHQVEFLATMGFPNHVDSDLNKSVTWNNLCHRATVGNRENKMQRLRWNTHPFLGQCIYWRHNFWLHIVFSSVKYYGVISNYLNWGPTTQSGNFICILMHLARFTWLADDLDCLMFLPMHVHVENNTSEYSSSANWYIIRPLLGHLLHIEPLLTRQINWLNYRTLKFGNFISF